MDNFKSVLLRLKEQLGIAADKEVAALLGFQEKAFNARKRRNTFPTENLYALSAKRPDLGLDVDYVLTGITGEAHSRLDAQSGAMHRVARTGASYEVVRAVGLAAKPNTAETAMIADWRNCSPEDRKLLNNLAASLAEKGKPT